MKTWTGALIVGGVGLVAVLAFAPRPAPAPELVEIQALGAVLSRMERQIQLLVESAGEAEAKYWTDVEPIERALLSTGRVRDPRLARVAAWALVREAESRHLSPALLAAVLQIENPWLVQDTVSFAGAVGWMQVMPFHAQDGSHPCGPDLTDGPTSVCYGADIMRSYLGRALDEALRAGLLAYNGCVSTPGCEIYASRVMARMGADK